MANYLKITYLQDKQEDLKVNDYQFRNKPFPISPIYELQVDTFELLTQGENVKRVYKLNFQENKEVKHDYFPGDVIAILPENDQTEINELFKRLNLTDQCNKYCKLDLTDDAGKKSIPKHLPTHHVTLKQIFLKYVDVRSVPKKLFLKALIKHTSDQPDIEKLQQICSPSGSSFYLKFIEENRSLLFLLNCFPSCNPPIELILEHSTPLNPRYFSTATSPLNRQLSIIFDVLELPKGLKGICSGWLEMILKENNRTTKIPVYFRKPGNFRLKPNIDKPIMLIATGTGLAPFIGFLDHFRLMGSHPEIWMFYGCRYVDRDFICKELLQSYANDGIIKCLFTSFSRDNEQKEYVQHKILKNKEVVIDFITNKEATIYVCGDQKTMVKDVKETLVNCFMDCKNVDRTDAERVLSDLVQNGKFLVDTWS
ncbi:methionine synthase reductase-like [Anthonomus grandis grandis]|uniref:methionine synthase reductase-like n=1 Tax=Anthonomus grandis grandis TaxID=2921223 RepID=UPI0021654130|nr:methionine synthase reductase-like [Anthonomus grandis grandis]